MHVRRCTTTPCGRVCVESPVTGVLYYLFSISSLRDAERPRKSRLSARLAARQQHQLQERRLARLLPSSHAASLLAAHPVCCDDGIRLRHARAPADPSPRSAGLAGCPRACLGGAARASPCEACGSTLGRPSSMTRLRGSRGSRSSQPAAAVTACPGESLPASQVGAISRRRLDAPFSFPPGPAGGRLY